MVEAEVEAGVEVEAEAVTEVEAAAVVVAAGATVVAVAEVAAAESGVEVGWAVVAVVVGPGVGVELVADGLLWREVLASSEPSLSALAEQMTAVTQHCLSLRAAVQASGVEALVSPWMVSFQPWGVHG